MLGSQYFSLCFILKLLKDIEESLKTFWKIQLLNKSEIRLTQEWKNGSFWLIVGRKRVQWPKMWGGGGHLLLPLMVCLKDHWALLGSSGHFQRGVKMIPNTSNVEDDKCYFTIPGLILIDVTQKKWHLQTESQHLKSVDQVLSQ